MFNNKASGIISDPCNQTSTLSNTAEIAETKLSFKFTPLRWSKFNPTFVLTSHSAGSLKTNKI